MGNAMMCEANKPCPEYSHNNYKTMCSLEIANVAKGKCPKISVDKNTCYKKCISNDKSTCKALSTVWPPSVSESNYIDVNGTCSPIPSSPCPPKQYRETVGGECKPLPDTPSCVQQKGTLTTLYPKGQTLNPSDDNKKCAQVTCNTKECKSIAMTCGEKNTTYKPQAPCGGDATLIKSNERFDIMGEGEVEISEINKQLESGGACCNPPPSCRKYLQGKLAKDGQSHIDPSCDSSKVYSPGKCIGLSEIKCRTAGCSWKDEKCLTLQPHKDEVFLNEDQFNKGCCGNPTCNQLAKGYCNMVGTDGKEIGENSCPTGSWINKHTIAKGTRLDPGKLRIRPWNDVAAVVAPAPVVTKDVSDDDAPTTATPTPAAAVVSATVAPVVTQDVSDDDAPTTHVWDSSRAAWRLPTTAEAAAAAAPAAVVGTGSSDDLLETFSVRGNKLTEGQAVVDGESTPRTILSNKCTRELTCGEEVVKIIKGSKKAMDHVQQMINNPKFCSKSKAEDKCNSYKYGTSTTKYSICKWDSGTSSCINETQTNTNRYVCEGDKMDPVARQAADMDETSRKSEQEARKARYKCKIYHRNNITGSSLCDNKAFPKYDIQSKNYSPENPMNEFLRDKCEPIMSEDQETCNKLEDKSSCISARDTGEDIIDSDCIISPMDEEGNCPTVNPLICKWGYNKDGERWHETSKGFQRAGDADNIMDEDPVLDDTLVNQPGCCREHLCKDLSAKVTNKLGYKIDAKGVASKGGSSICNERSMLRLDGPDKKVSDSPSGKAYCSAYDKDDKKIGTKETTKPYCNILNKGNIFGGDGAKAITDNIARVEWSSAGCCKPISCKDYTSLLIGRKKGKGKAGKFTDGDFKCGSGSSFAEDASPFKEGTVDGMVEGDKGKLWSRLSTIVKDNGAMNIKEDQLENYIESIKKRCCASKTCGEIKASREKEGEGCPIMSTALGYREDEITETKKAVFDGSQLNRRPETIDDWGRTSEDRGCCMRLNRTCSDVIKGVTGNPCKHKKIPYIWEVREKRLKPTICGDCDVGKTDANFQKRCCATPDVSEDKCSDGDETGMFTPKTCWNKCLHNNKLDLHKERITPGDNKAWKDGRLERDDGSDGSLCRPAFGHKKFESNFSTLKDSKKECKLKMFREFGGCVNKANYSECIAGVLSRGCSVSKNGGGGGGSDSWGGKRRGGDATVLAQTKGEYYEEPGSCTSFSWDVGSETPRYKTRPHSKVKGYRQKIYRRNPDLKDESPYTEQMPLSHDVDASILESEWKRESNNPLVSLTNKTVPLKWDAGGHGLGGKHHKAQKDEEGLVPIGFSPSLRAWQGYKDKTDTGLYTVSVGPLGDFDKTSVVSHSGPSRALGASTETDPRRQLKAGGSLDNIPYGGNGYGSELLDTQCFMNEKQNRIGSKCKDVVLDFSTGKDDQDKQTKQCPNDMYYDINKGNKTLRLPSSSNPPDETMYETAVAFANTCCSKEPEICEKFNLEGITGSEDSDVNDIFDQWKRNRITQSGGGVPGMAAERITGAPGQRRTSSGMGSYIFGKAEVGGVHVDGACTYLKDGWKIIPGKSWGRAAAVQQNQWKSHGCNPAKLAEEAAAAGPGGDMKWWNHIDGRHGYGRSTERHHEVMSNEGDVSVTHTRDGENPHRVQGHTVGCWTKCNANYINNNLRSRLDPSETQPGKKTGERCDKEFTFKNIKGAVTKCEQIIGEQISDAEITNIKKLPKEERLKKIEELLRNKTQCAIFKFPDKPGYEFKVDSDETITPPHLFYNSRGESATRSAENRIREAKKYPDIYQGNQVCDGKWLVVTEGGDGTGNYADKDESIAGDSGTGKLAPATLHGGTVEYKRMIEEKIKKMNNNESNKKDDQYHEKIKSLLGAWYVYYMNSMNEIPKEGDLPVGIGYSDSKGEDVLYGSIGTSGMNIKFVPNHAAWHVDGRRRKALASGGGDELSQDFIQLLGSVVNDAGGVPNKFDLRAGPNSVSSIGGKQVSLIYNNRCHLLNKLGDDQSTPHESSFFKNTEKENDATIHTTATPSASGGAVATGDATGVSLNIPNPKKLAAATSQICQQLSQRYGINRGFASALSWMGGPDHLKTVGPWNTSIKGPQTYSQWYPGYAKCKSDGGGTGADCEIHGLDKGTTAGYGAIFPELHNTSLRKEIYDVWTGNKCDTNYIAGKKAYRPESEWVGGQPTSENAIQHAARVKEICNQLLYTAHKPVYGNPKLTTGFGARADSTWNVVGCSQLRTAGEIGPYKKIAHCQEISNRFGTFGGYYGVIGGGTKRDDTFTENRRSDETSSQMRAHWDAFCGHSHSLPGTLREHLPAENVAAPKGQGVGEKKLGNLNETETKEERVIREVNICRNIASDYTINTAARNAWIMMKCSAKYDARPVYNIALAGDKLTGPYVSYPPPGGSGGKITACKKLPCCRGSSGLDVGDEKC